MMDRIARRVQEDPLYFATARRRPHAARAHQPRRDQRRRLPGRRDGRRRGDRVVHQLGRDRAARRARAARRRRSWSLTPNLGDGAAPRAAMGRALRPPRRHHQLQRHGAEGGAHRPSRGDRQPGPARRRSPPASRSARPARPTSCASPGSTAEKRPAQSPRQFPADPVAQRAAHDEIEVVALEKRHLLGEHRHAFLPRARHAGDVGAPEAALRAEGLDNLLRIFVDVAVGIGLRSSCPAPRCI